ncbi:hypothetical protein TSUD_133420 [Trifolium subterraneum]|uniref:Uncharacterized protein n=1 Tax=Trifolium subterraneum TaxID=3900 RepID=A0A2Z6NYH4_TRISU|nr:hypothetical protein TSUD_133420 [Trifolium subterraneum]
MKEDLKTAAKNVNYWTGTTTLMPLFGGFLADAYIGRFPMVLFSSLVYLMLKPGVKPTDYVSIHSKFKAMQHKDMCSTKKTSSSSFLPSNLLYILGDWWTQTMFGKLWS